MNLFDNRPKIIIIIISIILVLNFISYSIIPVFDQGKLQPDIQYQDFIVSDSVISSISSESDNSHNIFSISHPRNIPSGASNWPMFKNTGDRRGVSLSAIPGTSVSAPQILWSNNTFWLP